MAIGTNSILQRDIKNKIIQCNKPKFEKLHEKSWNVRNANKTFATCMSDGMGVLPKQIGEQKR